MKIPVVFWAIGALLAVSLVASGVQRAHQGVDAAARDSLHAALQSVERSKAWGDLLFERAQLAELRADAEARRADSLERANVRARVQYVTVRETAPAECAPVIAAANAALAVSDSVSESRAAALRSSQEAASGFRAARDTAQAALARLQAAATVVDRTRPSLLSRLAPRMGVGVAAGVNPVTGWPSLTTGITFGWTF